MRSHLRFATFVLAAAISACSPGAGDTNPARTCFEYMSRVGEACEPSMERCAIISDFWMGRCGNEEWICEDGRVAYYDFTFECSLPDGGAPDGGAPDGGARTACAEYVAPPAATDTPCRTDEDCGGAGAASCWAPGDTSAYYASGICPMECEDDSACGEGSVCVRINHSFCAMCRPACSEGSCRLWESCAADGHCRPSSCDGGGYTCPPGSACAPAGSGEVDAHGCSVVPCTSDAECGCGACVEGSCASGPGLCEPTRA